MSICDEIKAHHGKELFLVTPARRGAKLASDSTIQGERVLCVAFDINDRLCDPRDERWMGVAGDLAQFPEGRRLWLRKPNRSKDRHIGAFMVRLPQRKKGDPKEIWEIRSIEEEPQIRLFGRFACRDCFVALIWSERSDLDFSSEMRACEDYWKRLFGFREPLKGVFPNDYLSNTRFVP